VGARALADLANTLEQALRSGQREQGMAMATSLLAALDALLAGFAALEAPPAAPALAPLGADVAPLLQRLQALLRADDARAEDVLNELESALGSAEHGALLASVRAAVDDIEYPAALAALDALVRTLEAQREARA
jgi:two-component system sensor histidine kinase/response regulator